MNYIKIKVYAKSNSLEDMAGAIFEAIETGSEIHDPGSFNELVRKKNEYDWDYIDPSVEAIRNMEPGIEFYLEDSEKGLELLDEALETLRPFRPEKVEISPADSDDWQHKWKEYFKPVHITEKIVVRPSWEEYRAAAGELVIDLDPGMAFGTGDHPTSRLCIELMEEYMKAGFAGNPGQGEESSSLNGPAVLDIGAGSGILSLAAALLGAQEVLGIEIDPVAIPVAMENIKRNGQEEKITIIKGDLNEGVDFVADIVVANLMADLVIRLAPLVRPNLKENGVFISSGILIEKEDEIVKSLLDAGFIIDKIMEEGEWCAIGARFKQ